MEYLEIKKIKSKHIKMEYLEMKKIKSNTLKWNISRWKR